MALSAEVLDALLASGATAEMIVAVVKADLVASDRARVDRRTAAAERQRRCRARKRQSRDVSQPVTPVTRDACDLPPKSIYQTPHDIPPTPLEPVTGVTRPSLVLVEPSQGAAEGSGSNASASPPGDQRVVRLRTILLERHGGATFRSWFERLDWHIDGHTLTVIAPDGLTMDWVRNRLLGKVNAAARAAMGRDVEIMFTVKARAA
jgi:hypothetical protein